MNNKTQGFIINGANDQPYAFAEESEYSNQAIKPWLVLIADDEEGVHSVTRLALNGFTFDGRPIALMSAYSGAQALSMLKAHPDIALVLLDIIMETDDAGLKVIQALRGEFNNPITRIIIRTGQAGQVPERETVLNYDISDYKSKSDLTAQALFTTVIAALRSFRDLSHYYELNNELEYVVTMRTNEMKKAVAHAEYINQQKDMFIAKLAQELRGPINAILGYAQVARNDETINETIRSRIDNIMQAGNNVLNIVKDVLDLSRVDAGIMDLNETAFNFASLLESLKTTYSNRCVDKGLTWWFDSQVSEFAPLKGDARKIHQVLEHLLNNALKFTTSGEVALIVRPSGYDHYEFIVRDTGPGVQHHLKQKIFEAFFQSAFDETYTGIGLGLAIARKLTELMGGSLTLETPTEGGCEFCMRIPLKLAGVASQENPHQETHFEPHSQMFFVPDFAAFHLDEEFCQQIEEAARYNRISELRRLINDLSLADTAAKPLADYFLNLINDFNIDALLGALKEIEHVG